MPTPCCTWPSLMVILPLRCSPSAAHAADKAISSRCCSWTPSKPYQRATISTCSNASTTCKKKRADTRLLPSSWPASTPALVRRTAMHQAAAAPQGLTCSIHENNNAALLHDTSSRNILINFNIILLNRLQRKGAISIN